MKILCITHNVGGNAAGIIFERIIAGLSKIHKVVVFTYYNDKSLDNSLNNIQNVTPFSLHPRIQGILTFYTGVDLTGYFFGIRIKNQIKDTDKFDLILCLVSNHNIDCIKAGILLKKSLKSKLAVYSVDPIPEPNVWSNNSTFYRGKKRIIRKYLPHLNAFFSANKAMLNYQRTQFRFNDECIFDIIYTPSPHKSNYRFSNNTTKIFLYTGEIYGLRRSKYIIKAFNLLLKDYSDVQLHFIGCSEKNIDFHEINENNRQQIKIFPYANNLHSYFQNAYALIDIDADINDDVFLSSKIVNYITINRPILCETGDNSPSRNIFNGIQSIIQCGHNYIELYNGMKKLIEFPITDFSDREDVIKLFSIDENISKLNRNISKLVLTY
ncbi:MAG: hypothetical protein AB7S50_14030 [Bacteroidales bacterium]